MLRHFTKTITSWLQQKHQSDLAGQVSSLHIFNKLSSQEKIRTAGENSSVEQPKSSEIFDPTITDKAKQMTLRQRQKPTVGKD